MNRSIFRKLAQGTGLIVFSAYLTSCGLLGIGGGKGKAANPGELEGVPGREGWVMTMPHGMVSVPAGTFHMGQADEDPASTQVNFNKQVTIGPFYMDDTEITNNEYRQFTNWVRDSIAAKLLNNVKQNTVDGTEAVDWKKMATVKWGDKSTIEKIDAIIVTPDNRIFGKKEIDANKIVYQSELTSLIGFDNQLKKELGRRLKSIV